MENLFGKPELTRTEKMRAARKGTTDLTAWAINYLNNTGVFHVHRSNNFPSQRITKKEVVVNAFDEFGKPIEIKYEKVDIHFKSNNIKETILDISGFRADGIHFEAEVKTGKDKLSEGQVKRIKDITNSGGIAFWFTDKVNFMAQIEKYIIEKKYAF